MFRSEYKCLSSLPLRHSRFCRLMTMCVCVSPAKTTWSASQCCASTALPPSSPRHPSCFAPSTRSQAYGAAAQSASQAITAKQRSTCVIPTPAWTEACVPAEREGTPVSAVKITLVSMKGNVCWGGGVCMLSAAVGKMRILKISPFF